MKLLLMADNAVGFEITKWIVEKYPNDLALVVSVGQNRIAEVATLTGIATVVFESSQQLSDYAREARLEFDLGILAWWPKIIKPPLLSLPAHGFINTHPSLLPYNRGKHYSFWCLVEQAPFGVSLHFVEEGIDSGEVVAQAPIAYTWEDTSRTLCEKAAATMLALFKDNYPALRTLNITSQTQDRDAGSFHYASEIGAASEIDLEKKYRARDLLNLLRARTFPGHPGCWFKDGNEEFEIQIQIRKKT